MKAAIVVLADPTGGDDALGRVFNALAAAKDFEERGDDVSVLFQGSGTRWPAVLADETHPAHSLYAAVQGSIVGASDACATVFGARDGLTDAGLELIDENRIDGVGGLPSLARLSADGYAVLTF